MAAPILLDTRDTPIEVLAQVLNESFQNNTGITLSDLSQSPVATESIQSAIVESYLATASKSVVGTEQYDVIRPTMTICDGQILGPVSTSITTQIIQTTGNGLISQHSRNSTSPFQTGDIFEFPLVIRPGDFKITNDAPQNTIQGVQFFTTTVSGNPVLFEPGVTKDVSEWVYTLDSQNGPYYYGTEQDGFQVLMAIQLTGTPTPPISYNYTYALDWVKQPSTLNNSYTQEFTSVVMDSSLNTYTAFFSRTTSSSSSSQIVLVKMDSSGNIVWDTTQHTQFNSEVNSTARDERPCIVISESTSQIFLAYITNWAPYSETIHGGFDIRIVSVNTNTGNVLWTYRGSEINSSGNEDLASLSLSLNGSSLLVANSVRGNTSESNGVYQGTSTGYDDVIFAKLDLCGNHIWTTHSPVVNTTNTDIQPTITSDSLGNIYVAYISAGNVGGLGNSGSYDVYVIKADSSGGILGTFHPQGINTSVPDVMPKIQYSPYDNTLYLGHYTQFPFNVIITKLDLDCNVIWTENTLTNYDTTNEHLDITVDPTNGMCIFSYSATPNRPNNYDIIIGGIDPSGTVRFLENISGLQSINSGSELIPSIYAGAQDALAVAYRTNGVVEGSHSGSNDVVIAKLTKTPL